MPLAFRGQVNIFIEIPALWPQHAENPMAGYYHLRKRCGSALMTAET